jgi:hypothetical protein
VFTERDWLLLFGHPGDGSFLNEVMAQTGRAVDFPGGNWISSLVLCLSGWPNLVLGCADRAPCGDFTYCTEMTALTF